MNDLPEHIARWRERMLERGWLDRSDYAPAQQDMIVYHVVWNGEIWSGRCVLTDHSWKDGMIPGTHHFLLFGGIDEISVRLWRTAPSSD